MLRLLLVFREFIDLRVHDFSSNADIFVQHVPNIGL